MRTESSCSSCLPGGCVDEGKDTGAHAGACGEKQGSPCLSFETVDQFNQHGTVVVAVRIGQDDVRIDAAVDVVEGTVDGGGKLLGSGDLERFIILISTPSAFVQGIPYTCYTGFLREIKSAGHRPVFFCFRSTYDKIGQMSGLCRELL